MEDLGFAERGMAWKEVLAGTFDLDGELPVNPDGGLKSFGHPIGASGLRMLFECWLQLRGEAPAERQIASIARRQEQGPHPQPRRRARRVRQLRLGRRLRARLTQPDGLAERVRTDRSRQRVLRRALCRDQRPRSGHGPGRADCALASGRPPVTQRPCPPARSADGSETARAGRPWSPSVADSGNQRRSLPAACQLAVEVAGHRQFRSIFRSAVRAHRRCSRDGHGVGLSDSIAIIAYAAAAPGRRRTRCPGGGARPTAWPTSPIASISTEFWQWDELTTAIILGAILGAVLATVAAIALAARSPPRRPPARLDARDRRCRADPAPRGRAVAGRSTGDADPDLVGGRRSAVGSGTDDLRLVGLWIVGYGVIVVAASSTRRAGTPRATSRRRSWAGSQRRRASTRGTVLLGVGGLIVSLAVSSSPLTRGSETGRRLRGRAVARATSPSSSS